MDAASINALATLITGLLAGVGSILVLLKRSKSDDYDLLKVERDKYRKAYNILYAYAAKLYRLLISLGQSPDPLPEIDDDPEQGAAP